MSDTENNKETATEVEDMEEDNEAIPDTSKEEESSEEDKTPVKSSPKKAANEKAGESGSDDEEEEEELQPGLLERPVIIESGKRREKKKVERLSMQETVPKETKKFEVGDGAGDKFGECARIEFHISKAKVDDLKALHRLCFNSPGKATLIRKNLRLFNGFTFSKNDDEYKKKLANLKKQTVAVLKKMCEVLDLERKGVRDEIAERIMEFCLCPKDSGKAIPPSKKRKRQSKSGGKVEEKKKTVKKEKKTPKSASKPKKSTSDAEESESEEESDESKEESGSSEEEEEEEETPPAKKKKAETPKKPAAKKTPVKKETKKETKKEKKVSPKKAESSDEESDEDSDEEPLVKKKEPQPPSDKELKGLIKKILDKANLEEVTMKTVVKQVYAKYPTFDLSNRKDFIKETVREMIS